MRTVVIDIGGTGIKVLPLDARGRATAARSRELTPDPATPKAVLDVIRTMLAEQQELDRVSVGFPGVVVRGVVSTAPNLGTEAWRGFDMESAVHAIASKPVRVINDADLQGFGVIHGSGLEMVLTLGTGLGAALYTDGHLAPNLELGHHPFKKGKTYEQRISDAELARIGKKRFRRRVLEMLETLEPIFNYERVYIGGGNARQLAPRELPDNVTLFRNEEALRGGVRLWNDVVRS